MDADEEQEQIISEEDYPTDRNGTYLAEGITEKGEEKKSGCERPSKKPLTDRAVRKEAGVNSPSDKKQIVIRIILILFCLVRRRGPLRFAVYFPKGEASLYRGSDPSCDRCRPCDGGNDSASSQGTTKEAGRRKECNSRL